MRADLLKIERVARESADSMRDMVHLLSAKVEDGTADWLTVLADSARRAVPSADLDLRIRHDYLPRDPNLEVRREIYLFCKEGLHNASRHSGASRISLAVTPTREGIRIEISDNGCGFDTGRASAGHGLGNLRERAAIMKARMEIRSAPGNATSVILDVPRNRRWTERKNPI